MAKTSDFHNKSVDELKNLVTELRGKLFNLNFQSPDQKVKDTSQASKIRKDIARVLTIMQIKSKQKNG
jgi:large subunit ribosomal protein L29